MAKYSFKFKKKIVSEYLYNNKTIYFLAKNYNIPSTKSIQDWIKNYKEFGNEGLIRSRKNNNYSFEFKINVVKLYLTSEISYLNLAISQKIKTPSLVVKWVNDYRKYGPDALRSKKKGRKKSLSSNKDQTTPDKNIIETSLNPSNERIKELEDEILKLKIENAYLKKVRRLRSEENVLLKKQRE